MNATKTEVGTIYSLWASEIGNVVNIGDKVSLCSSLGRTGRSWYLHGPIGMIVWRSSAEESATLCDQWLLSNGYTAHGDLPPDCFEFSQSAH